MKDFFTIYDTIGFLITFISVVYVYSKSNKLNKKTNSIIISLLGLILTQLVSIRYDSFVNLESNINGLESNVEHFGEISQSPRALSVAKEIAQFYKINKQFPEFFTERVESSIRSFANDIHDANNLVFSVEADEMDKYSLSLINAVDISYHATSCVSMESWWNTEWGKKYAQINYDKAKKGAKIVRVFVFSDINDFNNQKHILQEQKTNGIKIKYIYANEARRNGISLDLDIAVVDGDKIGCELTLDKRGSFSSAKFSFNREKNNSMHEKINNLEDIAKDF